MRAYEIAYVPKAFPQMNTGVICYFNSQMQMLVGCPVFTRAVLENGATMRQTRTGAALLKFVQSYAGASRRQDFANAACPSATGTSEILAALIADLAERRPDVRFGAGQESASESLMFLLDMLEPPRRGVVAASAAGVPTSIDSPITRLFLHRERCEVRCRECGSVVSSNTDYAVSFNMFHLDQMRAPPATPERFSAALRARADPITGYNCSKCRTKTDATRVYTLTMVPEIVICQFNLYDGYGGNHSARYFPESFGIPAMGGGAHEFRVVAQVEHSGSLHGGHYKARGLRRNSAGPAVYELNDSHVSPSSFRPSAGTYYVVYNYMGQTD